MWATDTWAADVWDPDAWEDDGTGGGGGGGGGTAGLGFLMRRRRGRIEALEAWDLDRPLCKRQER